MRQHKGMRQLAQLTINNAVLATLLSLSLLSTSGCDRQNSQTVNNAQDTESVALLEESSSAGQSNKTSLKQVDNDASSKPLGSKAGTEVSANKSTAYYSPESLLPKLNTPVVDLTNTLSKAEQEALNQKIRDIYTQGILQIGVVIVPTTGDMSIYDYAMQVAKLWKLGDAKKNNGLLILVAMNERGLYVLTGRGVEDTLTDEQVAQHIETKITPAFKQGHFVQGLTDGIDAFASDVNDAL